MLARLRIAEVHIVADLEANVVDGNGRRPHLESKLGDGG